MICKSSIHLFTIFSLRPLNVGTSVINTSELWKWKDCCFSFGVHIFLLPNILKTDEMHLLRQGTILSFNGQLWLLMRHAGSEVTFLSFKGHSLGVLLAPQHPPPSSSSTHPGNPLICELEYCAMLRKFWFPHESYKRGKGLRGLRARERYWILFVNTF